MSNNCFTLPNCTNAMKLISDFIFVLITIPLINYLSKATQGTRGLFYLIVPGYDIIHHVGKQWQQEPGAADHHSISSQEVESDECWCSAPFSFIQSRTLVHGMMPLTLE